MNYKFQKIYYTVLFTLFLACSPDTYDFEPLNFSIVPVELQIAEEVGIKLENNFATSEARMNVKLNTTGNYYIKVLTNSGRLVSKEQVTGKLGDNLFKVYTSTLPKSSYRIELYLENDRVGTTSINLL